MSGDKPEKVEVKSIEDILGAIESMPDNVSTDLGSGIRKMEVEELPENALDVSMWSKRVSREMAEEWLMKQDLPEIADAHTACFEPLPETVGDCKDRLRLRWYEDLIESPEFKSLHFNTCLDDELSRIAAKQLTDRFTEYRAQVEEEQGDQQGSGQSGAGQDDIESSAKRAGSIRNAIREASRDVNDSKDAAAAFGLEDGTGVTIGSRDIASAFERIRNNEILRKIAEHAGRMIRLGKGFQQRKSVHGMDDMVGVTLGNDVSRLLPSELALLDTPMEDDLLRRIVENQAMVLDYRGIESSKQGPVMVFVDESGSMDTRKRATAKGFALSMAWLARYQHRWCCLVGWSSRNQQRVLVLEPKNTRQKAGQLMDWCCSQFNGGTCPPLHLVPKLFEQTGAPEGRTDVIWVTDGDCIPDGVDKFNAWREEQKVKCWTIGIGCKAESFVPFSDVVTSVTSLNDDEPIVEELLSI
jgi:uncharacterized protein with von Willebrand factor type A (vWA) domain